MQTLATDDIAKSYRGRRVVNGVSLHINQAEVVGLLGPNGAGKTTTFYMTVGLLPPDSGQILVDGQDITNVPMYLRARNYGISYLPQEPSVFRKLTVEENIMAVLEVQPITWQERRKKRDQLIDELGLGHIRNNMGYALSGGERRRVEVGDRHVGPRSREREGDGAADAAAAAGDDGDFAREFHVHPSEA